MTGFFILLSLTNDITHAVLSQRAGKLTTRMRVLFLIITSQLIAQRLR